MAKDKRLRLAYEAVDTSKHIFKDEWPIAKSML